MDKEELLLEMRRLIKALEERVRWLEEEVRKDGTENKNV